MARNIFTHPDPKKLLEITLANSTIYGIKAENNARSLKVIVLSQSPLKLPLNIPTTLGLVTLEGFYPKGSKTASLEVPAYTTDKDGNKHGHPVIASIIIPATPESLIVNAQIQGLKDYIEYLVAELRKSMPSPEYNIPAMQNAQPLKVTQPSVGEPEVTAKADDLPF